MDSIGERLREERERLGYSQTAFGALAEVTKQSQIKYEKGERSPDASYLAAIMRVGADVQYIVGAIRSSMALAPDEQELVSRYRAASLEVKAAAIGALTAASTTKSATRQEQVFHGSVGQAVKVEGGLDQQGISFFGKGKKRK
ncbi:transcriptional regulator [Burkholderia mayonis]|uniref:Transcriptional regulator n=1 Tax=Burkholderia mayonis TaxID=1385591 RepID=A0A1B4FN76_9BURK|nr:helix-turn-helix transcriptional regulator [Burkholderia mayonis]AOJ05113.1 transcriptional regulator [Burkholderia mayonis]KVE41636.1 transcriptional regulator [Burkholderia mayonis]